MQTSQFKFRVVNIQSESESINISGLLEESVFDSNCNPDETYRGGTIFFSSNGEFVQNCVCCYKAAEVPLLSYCHSNMMLFDNFTSCIYISML